MKQPRSISRYSPFLIRLFGSTLDLAAEVISDHYATEGTNELLETYQRSWWKKKVFRGNFDRQQEKSTAEGLQYII